jgi:hypothetical protein
MSVNQAGWKAHTAGRIQDRADTDDEMLRCERRQDGAPALDHQQAHEQRQGEEMRLERQTEQRESADQAAFGATAGGREGHQRDIGQHEDHHQVVALAELDDGGQAQGSDACRQHDATVCFVERRAAQQGTQPQERRQGQGDDLQNVGVVRHQTGCSRQQHGGCSEVECQRRVDLDDVAVKLRAVQPPRRGDQIPARVVVEHGAGVEPCRTCQQRQQGGKLELGPPHAGAILTEHPQLR